MQMSYSRRSRYSDSLSPYRRYSRSVSRSRSRSRSRAFNPVTKRDLEKHFSTEGKVEDVHLVVDPWTRESRGFGFVTMSTLEEADRCIKYLDRSVLEGRVITVEKARRRRGRTPTPGKYLGLRTVHAAIFLSFLNNCSAHVVRRRSPSYSTYSRSRSPRYSSERDRSRSRSRSRSYSPYYSRRRRSYSPPYARRRSYSPYYMRGRSYSRSRSRSYSRSPVSRRDRSYSPYYRDYSPDDRCYRRRYWSSRDYSPDDRYRGRHRSTARSISPRHRLHSRRSYSRSVSPGRSRSYSRSVSPRYSRRSYSRSGSPSPRKSSRREKSCSVSPRRNKSLKRSASHDSWVLANVHALKIAGLQEATQGVLVLLHRLDLVQNQLVLNLLLHKSTVRMLLL
ncbi:UNVERIFIED_CONTAM: Serine/arginine-rich splicing factor a [Sesamum radiatum]|uniref:Serine/arginine-rich splicing factor a n=1 Tax=Sesamum radiatum TaxID=300843 RepID=A0AAW2UPK8_SESRA